MSDDTPERLKQFRAEYRQREGRGGGRIILAVVCVLLGVATGALCAHWVRSEEVSRRVAPSASAGGLSPDQLREYALYLEQKALPQAAIAAYEEYLERAALADDARARVCYTVAKLALDNEQYEKALAYLYQAEMFGAEAELKGDIDKKIVLCLDRLGRTADLRRELRTRTAPKRTAQDVEAGEIVLAEFAGEVITDRDLETELAKLPASVAETFDSPDKKAEFLKNLVAERLLLDKAFRVGLDKDPKVQEELGAARDAMIVRRLIADEVKAKVQITPEDVERYYKAEPARFTEPATAEVRIGKADSEAAARQTEAFSEKPVTVREGGDIPGVPAGPQTVESVFKTAPGATTEPVQLGDAWYVFRVERKTPARVRPFEEVRDQATRMLQFQKEQEQLRALIEETLRARDVRLFPERLKEAQGKS